MGPFSCFFLSLIAAYWVSLCWFEWTVIAESHPVCYITTVSGTKHDHSWTKTLMRPHQGETTGERSRNVWLKIRVTVSPLSSILPLICSLSNFCLLTLLSPSGRRRRARCQEMCVCQPCRHHRRLLPGQTQLSTVPDCSDASHECTGTVSSSLCISQCIKIIISSLCSEHQSWLVVSLCA